ncbi:MAG: YmfL family putative regulatory protein [Vibrio sp.]
MNRKEMIKLLIKNYTGGKEVAAASLGYTLNAFNNRQYESNNHPFFTFDDLVVLSELQNSPAVAEYFALKTGHVVIKKPEPSEIGKKDLYDCESELKAKVGELAITVYEAERDGVLTNSELKKIEDLEYEVDKKVYELRALKKKLFSPKYKAIREGEK